MAGINIRNLLRKVREAPREKQGMLFESITGGDVSPKRPPLSERGARLLEESSLVPLVGCPVRSPKNKSKSPPRPPYYVRREVIETPALNTSQSRVILDGEKEVAAAFGVTRVTARFLALKFLASDSARIDWAGLHRYLHPNVREEMPPLASLRGNQEGAALAERHIVGGGRIGIISDFDVDGACSAAIRYLMLRHMGCEVEVRFPSRRDGYGPNIDLLRDLKAKGCTLIYVHDCGSQNHDLWEYVGKEMGMEIDVTDHHSMGRLPNPRVAAFRNPSQIGCGFADNNLSAAALTWVSNCAILERLRKSGSGAIERAAQSFNEWETLAFAAVANIADVTRLVGFNRALTAEGLRELARTKYAGLCALNAVAGVGDFVYADDIGYGIGPRINAAGRMAHASLAFRALVSDSSVEAQRLAAELDVLNESRKDLEKRQMYLVEKALRARGPVRGAIALFHRDIRPETRGIVAGRLAEISGLPTLLMNSARENEAEGSARSGGSVSIADIFERIRDGAIKSGGHAAAGGVSVERRAVEQYLRRFCGECERDNPRAGAVRNIEGHMRLDLPEFVRVRDDLIRDQQLLEPFGMGNEKWTFVADHVQVSQERFPDRRHLKFAFSQLGTTCSGVLWHARWHGALQSGRPVRLAYSPVPRPRAKGYQDGDGSIEVHGAERLPQSA